MPSTAKFLTVSLSLVAMSWLVIRQVYGIDEGVVADEVAAVVIPHSKCLTRACKGAHSEGGKHCQWTQKEGLTGTCMICDGNEHAWLCGIAPNQKCEVNPKAAWSKVYCGVKAEGECRKSESSPTGATCIRLSLTQESCILTSCKQPASQDVEDPLGP